VLPSDRVTILFFVTMVSVFVASIAVTFYYSSMISPFLKLDFGINQRVFQLGIWWCYRIGIELSARVAICFFVTMVSVCICSVVVTFDISYVISPFLDHVIGINRREILFGLQCYHWMGVVMETRVGIRFFVTKVSVLSPSLFQFFYDLTVSRAWLRHHSTQNSIRNIVVLSDWRRVVGSCRNPFFCRNGKCFVSFIFLSPLFTICMPSHQFCCMSDASIN
jgi:hypothetical protein